MSRDGRDAGFTLVEMLVALALLGIMTAYAIGALRSLGQIARVTAETEAEAEMEAAARHLRQAVADARAVYGTGPGNQRLAFEGTAQNLVFVTVLNDRLERGGLFRLEYGPGSRDGEFTLRSGLHRPRAAAGSVAVREAVLLRGVEGLAFSYCSKLCATGGEPWSAVWTAKEELPALVRVSVTFPPGDKRRWPAAAMPVMASY